ncbi:hypothetical protein NGM10_13605 [Halorussus salilacus]|uniref:hypothetical protein n=1 Tax=Halorussus salilacus TaxID=2953750 RepID=UPI00209D1CB1|nr:hypothetical protein [Halorussus salilacus]USZ67758.1 hypothetical protein NGM10_13605 [Halorussus salilacus]
MSSTGKRHELATERRLLREAYADRQPRGTELRYRNHTIAKEPRDDTLAGTWRIVSPDGEYLATVDLDDFDSAGEWMRFVDAVIHSGVEEASEWFDVTHA